MTSAFPPIRPVRLRRALGLAATVVALGLGAAPAVSAPLAGLLTLPVEPAEPTPAPTPPGIELRPIELPILGPVPLPKPAPAPGPEPAPLLAPGPGLDLTPLVDSAGEALTSLLSHVVPGSSSAPSGGGSTAPDADTPQGTGSRSPEPTTGAPAPKAGARDPGPAAERPAPASSGTVTAAALMPVIDAVSRPIGPSRRSREIAATDRGRSAAPVRVAALGVSGTAAFGGRAAPFAAVERPAPAPAAVAGARRSPILAAVPQAARRVAGAVAGAGRSPWLPIALLLGVVAYVLSQRLIDGGAKLSHAGRDEPDDELIEL